MVEVNATHEIIRSVLRQHMIHKDDFYSACREPNLVAARIDAAKQLREAGKTIGQIALALKRSNDTIRYYLEPGIKRRKTAKHTETWPLSWLDPDARKVVVDYALAEETSPRVIIAQWIAERASYEASQKEAA